VKVKVKAFSCTIIFPLFVYPQDVEQVDSAESPKAALEPPSRKDEEGDAVMEPGPGPTPEAVAVL